MFKRQRAGSVVCVSCGYLVGVNDAKCYHCGRRNPGLWGFAPALRSLGHDLGFVPFVTGLCIVMYAVSLVLSGGGLGPAGLLSFLSPNRLSLLVLGASGAEPVFWYGRWWTVITAGWLHGGLLHIFFNMLWVRQLAPTVGELYGPGRMVIVYTVAGACGFALSSVAGEVFAFVPIRLLQGGQVTVGASASIFGLLGAIVYYGRRTGSQMAGSQAWYWAVMMFILGLVMPGVDNYAHAGGFAGGYLAGLVLDPLKPERIDHMLAAVVCLGLSLVAILVSVVHAFL
jgi:rhomboid protease GluP